MNTKKSALRSDDIRKGNEKLVLRLVQQYEYISQSRIVEITGLKAPTILRIFTNLEDLGLIQLSDAKVQEPSAKKGRKPVYYCLNPNALFVIGVEFWALSATVVISNFIRKPVFSKSISLDHNLDGKTVLQKISDLIEESIAMLELPRDQIIGVGIGAPGRVDTHEGIVQFYSRIKGLNDINIKQYLEDQIDLEIHVHNNTSVIAMNEFRGTFSGKAQNIFAILIRGGVGGAYINEGKIVTSGNITSLEIGHMSVVPGGRECSCGWQGCLETYLSEEIVIQDIRNNGVDSINIENIGTFLNDNGSNDTIISKQVLKEKSNLLAFAVKNITNILSPDIFLLISRNLALSTYLADQIRIILDNYPPYPEKHSSQIVPVLYNPLHAGLGACDIIFQHFFQETSPSVKDQQ